MLYHEVESYNYYPESKKKHVNERKRETQEISDHRKSLTQMLYFPLYVTEGMSLGCQYSFYSISLIGYFLNLQDTIWIFLCSSNTSLVKFH